MRGKDISVGCVVVLSLLAGFGGGCDGTSGLFNAAFVNTVVGGGFPLTPGPLAPFVLVRVVNDTGQNAEFIVTVERIVIETDDDGNFLFEADGTPVTRVERETKRLATFPGIRVNDLGVLFDCRDSPVTKVGLGENLLPGDAAVFIGGGGPAGAAGFGIRAENLNPLSLEAGNFNCGDTVIFQAFQAIGVAGGVRLQAFVLPGSEQPGEFRGPSTFENFSQVIESQVRETEP